MQAIVISGECVHYSAITCKKQDSGSQEGIPLEKDDCSLLERTFNIETVRSIKPNVNFEGGNVDGFVCPQREHATKRSTHEKTQKSMQFE